MTQDQFKQTFKAEYGQEWKEDDPIMHTLSGLTGVMSERFPEGIRLTEVKIEEGKVKLLNSRLI